jgi:hypothetical protein
VGECKPLVQGCYVAFGPDWPRSVDHRTALRWVGFTELHGGASHGPAICSYCTCEPYTLAASSSLNR